MKNLILVSILLSCILLTGYVSYTVNRDTDQKEIIIRETGFDESPGIILTAIAIIDRFPTTIDPNDQDYR